MSAQAANELAGRARAAVADLLDRQLSPPGLRAMAVLSPVSGEVVLDVGCGAGQTVLQLADRVGPAGRVIAVDISSTMLEVARRRAAERTAIEFVAADAATLALAAGSLDAVYSRFGVMAFDDPVAAFSNLRRMLRSEGRLAFVCWRALVENELDWLPLRAAGLETMLDPTPFSLAEPDGIRAILAAAGFREIAVTAHDEPVSSGGIEDTLTVLLGVGPLGRILRENPLLRPAAEARVRAALAERGQSEVSLNAATWIVSARR